MIAPWYTGVLKFLHCSICNILSYHSYRFWGGVCKFIFLPYKQVECSTKIMMGCLQVIGIFTLEIWGFYSGHFTLCICVGVSNFPSCDVNLFNIPRVNLSGIVWDFSYVAGSVCRCCVLWGVHLSFLPAIASSPLFTSGTEGFQWAYHWME